MKILLLIFFLSVHSCFAQTAVPAYTEATFNSDTCCWRKLAAAGNYKEAGMLITAYTEANKHVNKHALHWHAGQMFASAQENRLALKYFKKIYNIFYKIFGGRDGKEWYYYAKGTAAFIKRDKKRLAAVIHRWNKKFEPTLNYKGLVALFQNWDQPYQLATK